MRKNKHNIQFSKVKILNKKDNYGKQMTKEAIVVEKYALRVDG